VATRLDALMEPTLKRAYQPSFDAELHQEMGEKVSMVERS
jgi:hypothetical protein